METGRGRYRGLDDIGRVDGNCPVGGLDVESAEDGGALQFECEVVWVLDRVGVFLGDGVDQTVITTSAPFAVALGIPCGERTGVC